MSRLKQMIGTLEDTLKMLKPFANSSSCPPEEGCFFRTINGSIVNVLGLEEGDAKVVVLRGGHGISHARGEEPGETYSVDLEGIFNGHVGPELGMSLAEKLPMELPQESAEDVGLGN